MQPPLTPMIDVTFQLLLFFLLTFTFRPAEGQIPGSLPRKGLVAESIDVPWSEPIRISLRPAGAERTGVIFEVSGLDVGITRPQKLYEHLLARQERLGTNEVPVIIDSRSNVRWRYVVEAFNQSVRAKYKNIGFASGG